jgi:membrane-associated phospholipid phosphatase
MPATWNFITDLGDTAVTIPLALLTLCFLGGARARPLAFGWMIAILGCGIAIAALKLLLGLYGVRLGLGHLTSPSGHAAISTAVYGSLALLIATRLRPAARWLLYIGAALLILGIAISRKVLGHHSLPEIAAGLIAGLAAVAVFRIALLRRPAELPLGWLIGTGVVLIALLHGTRWPTELVIDTLAAALHLPAS